MAIISQPVSCSQLFPPSSGSPHAPFAWRGKAGAGPKPRAVWSRESHRQHLQPGARENLLGALYNFCFPFSLSRPLQRLLAQINRFRVSPSLTPSPAVVQPERHVFSETNQWRTDWSSTCMTWDLSNGPLGEDSWGARADRSESSSEFPALIASLILWSVQQGSAPPAHLR